MILDILGPLGNGFPKKSKKAILIGGGIGIPPMLELAKELECEKQIVLGYRDELFLTEEFEKAGEIYLATEDGSMGTKGTVLDAIRVNELKADIIYACGLTPMLKAVKEYAKEAGIECWISMEERWHAESEHALPAYASPDIRTAIRMCITNVSVKKVRYF